jgi:hypothetical protein
MKSRTVDMVSLVFGGAFLSLVAMWVVVRFVTLDLPSFSWLLATGLVVLGLAGLAASVPLRRRRDQSG